MSVNSPNLLTCPGVPELPASFEEPPVLLPPLETPPALSPPPKKSGSRWWLVTMIAVIILLLISPLVYGATIAGFAVQRAKAAVDVAQESLLAKDFDKAKQAVIDTQADLATIRVGLASVWFWKDVPFVGRQLELLDQTAGAAEGALRGVTDVIDAVGEIQQAMDVAQAADGLELGIAPDRSFKDLTPEEKRVVLARFNEVLPTLRLAREKFQLALDAWNRIPQDELYAPIRAPLQKFTAVLPDLQLKIDEAMTLLDVFLPMAGYPTPKNYLVVLQNADEMRPSGGFLGNVGEVKVDAADLKNLEFQDVYAIDNPVSGVWKEVPPEPVKRELGVPYWFFRDSNWSPDFPTSAERMMDFYDRELTLASVPHEPLDGAIALQPGFFEDLFKLTGPIVIDGEEFNSENFFDKLEYKVEIGWLTQGVTVDQRKEIVGRLGDAMIERLMNQPASKWGDLLDFFTRSLEKKDVLIYVRDPKTLALLDVYKWSGRTQAPEGDFVWVADANLAALKTDGVMDKEIRYAVNMTDPNGPTATVTLHYKNTNRTPTWRYTRYRDYVRVYVPDGSEFISSEGAMANDRTKTGGKVVAGKVDLTRELGKVTFGAFWAIEPGETRDLSFTYRIAPSIVEAWKNGSYALYAQKQPGSKQRLTLDLQLGKTLTAAEPPETKKEYGDTRYRVSGVPLETDRTFQIKLSNP
ncbi:MAG: DUF4012 domain-containing protein [bacterium]|nr:DUF4012 domain-containing protein [bacterium]